MSSRVKSVAAILAVAVVASAVVVAFFKWQAGNGEDMADLAEALRPVSSAVDGYLNFSEVPVVADGKELLIKATEHNSKLLERFAGYVVLVRRDGLASSVLVCDADRKHALMEDSGCTGPVDARLWEQPTLPVCDFQLDLQQVCGVN